MNIGQVFSGFWLYEAGGILAGLAVLYFLGKYLVHKKVLVLGSVDIEKVFFPVVKALCWLLGVYYVLALLLDKIGLGSATTVMSLYKNAMVFLLVTWALHRWWEAAWRLHIGARFSVIGKIVTAVLVLSCTAIILRIFGVDVMPLLAFGGIGAAVAGFAAKDVVGNGLGGFIVSATQPFQIGDWIVIPEKEIEGNVEEIGWCLTKIQDRDRRMLYLPNALFSQLLVVNTSQRLSRKIGDLVRVPFAAWPTVESLIVALKKHLEKLPGVDRSSGVLVFLSQVGPYAIEISWELYTHRLPFAEYVLQKDAVWRCVLSVLQKEGVEVAYPVFVTNSLHSDSRSS